MPLPVARPVKRKGSSSEATYVTEKVQHICDILLTFCEGYCYRCSDGPESLSDGRNKANEKHERRWNFHFAAFASKSTQPLRGLNKFIPVQLCQVGCSSSKPKIITRLKMLNLALLMKRQEGTRAQTGWGAVQLSWAAAGNGALMGLLPAAPPAYGDPPGGPRQPAHQTPVTLLPLSGDPSWFCALGSNPVGETKAGVKHRCSYTQMKFDIRYFSEAAVQPIRGGRDGAVTSAYVRFLN